MLPLDLHVLSLPLAFILSQDQTLHCINIYISQPEPDALNFWPASRGQESTLLVFILFSVLAFLYFIQSSQWTCHRHPFEWECKGKPFFLISKTFFTFFERSPNRKNAGEIGTTLHRTHLSPWKDSRFSNGAAKVGIFPELPKLFWSFFSKFFQPLNRGTLTECRMATFSMNSRPRRDARFSNGDAKVALFISIANFFSTFLQLFSRTDDSNHKQNSL